MIYTKLHIQYVPSAKNEFDLILDWCNVGSTLAQTFIVRNYILQWIILDCGTLIENNAVSNESDPKNAKK